MDKTDPGITMLVKKVVCFIERHRLLEEGDRVLVAVSGGPDSLCLLHLLCRLAPRYRLDLIVAHLDHQIRPEARREAEAVRRLAAAWSLPYEGAAIDVPAFRAGRKLSASEASRVVRYRFLLEAAEKHKANKIALGQQLDDQAETVLFNLLRGTGPDGLAGILPRRKMGPVELIRPLLAISRREIERYCREQGLKPSIDLSNLKKVYTRNRIRLELIPYLEENYNPRLRRSLAHLASLVAADRAYLETEAQKMFQQLAEWEKGCLIIDRAALAALPDAMRGRVVCRVLSEFVPSKRIGRRQVQQLLQLVEQTGPARELRLPGGARAYCSYGRLILTAKQPEKKEGFSARPLQIPGCTDLPNGSYQIEACFCSPGELSWPPQPRQAYLDYDTLPASLTLRSRWPGARFHPQGAPGGKKLKDFMINQKIPRHQRDSYPLVVAGNEVVWVIGQRIAHPYRVTAKTSSVLTLELKRSTQRRRSIAERKL